MAIFKCKMCGGTLEINNNESVAICEYCGTKQTLPNLDDEKRVQLYDRANYFRRENEFDKAMGIYEMILSDDKEDCESYWGIVLCRYGIEYVEDPRTHKRIPTVNRAQFTSIFDDEDYKKAIEYADTLQKIVYEEEAAVIDKIQKGILQISSKEEPFDIFICYKETDSHGSRTQDSVYAQDIYTALTKEGYKVFFSRITLEDKLGSAYEPYIFAALNSAKVMLVVGTNKDNFNAVWVKNEWSRYLTLIKAGKEKTLIPVYKDISPYEMPEEFQYLQSQDMGKIGYLQDLVRGVSKLIDVKEVKVTVEGQSSTETISAIVDTMLKKAYDALLKREWDKAIKFFDNVIDYDDNNEYAYTGKLLSDFKVVSLDELSDKYVSITSNKNYIYLINNASFDTKTKLERIANIIEEKIEVEKVAQEEKRLKEKQEKEERIRAKNKKIKKKLIIIFSFVVLICSILAVVFFVVIPSNYYNKANELYENGDYASSLEYFDKVSDYKDSAEKKYEIEAELLKNAKIGDVVFFGSYIYDVGGYNDVVKPIEWYVVERNDSDVLLISKDCLDARVASLTNYDWTSSLIYDWLVFDFYSSAFNDKENSSILYNNDTSSKVYIFSKNEFMSKIFGTDMAMAKPTPFAVSRGIQVAENGNSCWWTRTNSGNDVVPILSTGEAGDSVLCSTDFVGVRPVIRVELDLSEEDIEALKEEKYQNALNLYNEGKLDEALVIFEELKSFKDSENYVADLNYKSAIACIDEEEYLEAINLLESNIDYLDSNEKILFAKYQYCIDTQKYPTNKTKEYLKELIDIDYEDAISLEDTVFAWIADIDVSYGLIGGSINLNATLSGGDGGKTKVKFVTYIAGETVSFCDEKEYGEGQVASSSVTSNMYNLSAYSFTVKIYDGEGNLIGEKSVEN